MDILKFDKSRLSERNVYHPPLEGGSCPVVKLNGELASKEEYVMPGWLPPVIKACDMYPLWFETVMNCNPDTQALTVRQVLGMLTLLHDKGMLK